MKLVIFGLSISSSWGNGHATLWRGLCRALARQGHTVVFFEKDVPYYASHRDKTEPDGVRLVLYRDWNEIQPLARRELDSAEVSIITSYCPDALAATRLLLDSKVRLRVFYDLDTPVTLERLAQGLPVEYLGEDGLKNFNLVLSYTGGRALTELKEKLGAKRVAPLYGSVDPEIHFPVQLQDSFRADLSYLGTYAANRQKAVELLLLEPAQRLAHRQFLIGGSMYPQDFPWKQNIFYRSHVPPPEHAAFYCSSRLTLNITRSAMALMGYCPSGRLFESAACGVPVLSDTWEGLDQFFVPGKEIILAETADQAVNAIELSDRELQQISKAARARTLTHHTAEIRAQELERILDAATRPCVPSISKAASARDIELRNERTVWGIIPAAGAGTRIQPLAFSKELLPIGSYQDCETERPRAVSEFLIERMVLGGATRLCFVISPGKNDIISYYGGSYGPAQICYTVQPKPAGLCDALFRAAPFVRADDLVLVGLPDTIWFPEEGFHLLHNRMLSFLLFPVEHPEYFDAVVHDEKSRVTEIQVKKKDASSTWVWGAFKLPGEVFHRLYHLWCERGKNDEYLGTLVNAYIAEGGEVVASRFGTTYSDVGTLHGYREAVTVLQKRAG